MERYSRLSTPPSDATKAIEAGKLKGKTDINPQWKIEAMTQEYGECGVGWWFDIIETNTVPLNDGQILLFMQVAVFTRNGERISNPVIGCGGDFIVKKNKNGLEPNDEAYKMCLTDALGNALKCLGVGATIFRGKYDTKYNRPIATEPKPIANEPKKWVGNNNGETMVLSGNGKWYPLKMLPLEKLNDIINDSKYKECHAEARVLMAEKALC
jgi:hypothetical protein